MKAKVINPHAIRYGEIVEVEPVWTDSYITTDGDEIHYGKDELEFVGPNWLTMTVAELKEKLGMNSRVGKVKCKRCGKELVVPNMYGKDLELFKPYCCSATVLTVQWLIHHGWHITTYEANPPGAYLCPDCYNGQPEYHKSQDCEAWCEQAEKWMKENGGKR